MRRIFGPFERAVKKRMLVLWFGEESIPTCAVHFLTPHTTTTTTKTPRLKTE
jgi:hypothetical protein